MGSFTSTHNVLDSRLEVPLKTEKKNDLFPLFILLLPGPQKILLFFDTILTDLAIT
jgi:hypothetical protein